MKFQLISRLSAPYKCSSKNQSIVFQDNSCKSNFSILMNFIILFLPFFFLCSPKEAMFSCWHEIWWQIGCCWQPRIVNGYIPGWTKINRLAKLSFWGFCGFKRIYSSTFDITMVIVLFWILNNSKAWIFEKLNFFILSENFVLPNICIAFAIYLE